MATWIILSAVFFLLMTVIWVKGLEMIRKIKPDWMVPFYFGVSALRFIMALAIVLLYLKFADHTTEEAVIFCITFALLYLAMIFVSVILKH